MPDYSNGKIYKIVCNITGEQYIGGTIQKLSQRLTQHVRDKNKDKGYKSKEIILRGDYQIILIENYPCNSKEELERKEREHIEANVCVNKYITTRTRKEYREAHKEELALKDKEYKEAHKEAISLKYKEYYDCHKEAIYLKNKEYIDKNRESVRLKSKAYREKNKEELNRKKREYRNKKKQEKMEAVDPII